MNENEVVEPYRVFFPLGILSSIIGVSLWFLFTHRWISFYPLYAHSNIMFFAFLWSFVVGFLMTAIPKMTGTFPVKISEFSVSVFLVFLQLSFSLRNNIEVSFLIFIFQVLALMLFLIQRFVVYKKIPFEGFIFLPFAFAQIFICFSLYYFKLIEVQTVYLLSGEAFLVNLILGLGSRLVPVISRIPNALMPNVIKKSETLWLTIFLAVVLNVSYVYEAIYGTSILDCILKFTVISFLSYKSLALFKIPNQWGIGPVFIKISILLLNLVMLLRIFNFQSKAINHIIYIGFFVLLTIMIASRVMLAHAGQFLDYELKSKKLFIIGSLILISTICRLIFGANIASSFLGLTIIFFMISMILWVHKFFLILKDEKK